MNFRQLVSASITPLDLLLKQTTNYAEFWPKYVNSTNFIELLWNLNLPDQKTRQLSTQWLFYDIFIQGLMISIQDQLNLLALLNRLDLEQLKQTLLEYLLISRINWLTARDVNCSTRIANIITDLLIEWKIDGQLLYHFPDLLNATNLTNAIKMAICNIKEGYTLRKLQILKQLIAADLRIQSGNQLININWLELINQPTINWSFDTDQIEQNILSIEYVELEQSSPKLLILSYFSVMNPIGIIDILQQQLRNDYALKYLSWLRIGVPKLNKHQNLLNKSDDKIQAIWSNRFDLISDPNLRTAVNDAILQRIYNLNRDHSNIITANQDKILKLIYLYGWEIAPILASIRANYGLKDELIKIKWN